MSSILHRRTPRCDGGASTKEAVPPNVLLCMDGPAIRIRSGAVLHSGGRLGWAGRAHRAHGRPFPHTDPHELPPGLTLGSTAPDFNNVLTGTPTQAGTFSFPMQVQDSQDNTATGTVTITINP
jgi:hypothetical protein